MAKIQLVMILCNSEDTIIQTLTSYLGEVQRFFLYINNSTDKTLELIENFKNNNPLEKVVVYKGFFDGFSNTRNRALDLSCDEEYYYTIMPDDSYELIGTLKGLRGLNKECIAMNVLRNNISYLSKRIIKTSSKIRFVGNLHEIFEKDHDHILTGCHLNDIPTDIQVKRTEDRLLYDIEQLKNCTSPRDLYYLGNLQFKLYYKGQCDAQVVIDAYRKRLEIPTTDHEEIYTCFMHIGHLFTSVDDYENAARNYLGAALSFPNRSGEAYYALYLVTDKKGFLEKAYKNRKVGFCRMAYDTSVEAQITEAYLSVFEKF